MVTLQVNNFHKEIIFKDSWEANKSKWRKKNPSYFSSVLSLSIFWQKKVRISYNFIIIH